MTEPPFSVALRLSLEVAREGDVGLEDLVGARWRERLSLVASREPGSRRFPDDVVPHRAEAGLVVAQTFSDHPLVNVGGRPVAGTVKRGAARGGPQAFVIAEVVLRPELASIPPGGLYPDVTDGVISDPHVIHATPWPYVAGSDGERAAAAALLQTIVAELPERLWRQDG